MYDGLFRSGIGCIVFCAILALLFYPFWRIVTKAGYPGLMSLLFFIPAVNFIFLWIAALSEWPIERQLRELKSRSGMPPG